MRIHQPGWETQHLPHRGQLLDFSLSIKNQYYYVDHTPEKSINYLKNHQVTSAAILGRILHTFDEQFHLGEAGDGFLDQCVILKSLIFILF